MSLSKWAAAVASLRGGQCGAGCLACSSSFLISRTIGCVWSNFVTCKRVVMRTKYVIIINIALNIALQLGWLFSLLTIDFNQEAAVFTWNGFLKCSHPLTFSALLWLLKKYHYVWRFHSGVGHYRKNWKQSKCLLIGNDDASDGTSNNIGLCGHWNWGRRCRLTEMKRCF